MTRLRLLFPAVLAAATCALLVPAAHAALPDPVWLEPEAVAPAGAASSAQGVMGGMSPIGGTVAFWLVYEGGHAIVRGSYRAPGADWQTPFELGPSDVDTYPSSWTSTEDGTITIAYGTSDGRAYVRDLSPAGALGEPQLLLSDPGRSGGCANLATGADGTSYVVWCESETYMRVRPAGSSEWGPAEVVSESDTDSPVITVAPNGRLTVLYRNSNTDELRARTREPGESSWSPGVTVSGDPDDLQVIQATIDGGDRVVATWKESNGGTDSVKYAVYDGGWSPVGTLAASGAVVGTVTTGGDGAAVALWLTTDGMSYFAHSATLAPGADSFGTPQDLNPPGEFAGVSSFARRPDGTLYATMLHGSSLMNAKLGPVSRSAAGGPWSAPDDFDSVSIAPENNTWASADAAGNLVIGWESADGSPMVAAGDGAGPVVSGVDVPATGAAGEEVTLSASALDVWSDVSEVSWDLGDGRRKTGSTVSASYAAAGTYTVRVSATDSVGHVTTISRQIAVSAPPAPETPAGPEPKTTDTPKQTLAPVIEARLAGRTVTVNAKVTLKSGKRCSGTVKATTAFGGRSYKTTLRLATKAGACRATGTIKLKKTPSLRTKLRVTVSGGQVKTRALTTRRG